MFRRLSRFVRFAGPFAALGLAGLFWIHGSEANAFAGLGGQLGLAQRDFRVFNNFSDASANDNWTPHANFPGQQGATVAIWKGCLEWGSSMHGDGQGDPHQMFSGIGSGGANFDASFQGLATGVGTADSNTHSEIAGSSGGLLAYCESPAGAGWRIRYYADLTWEDGPETDVHFSETDLQGVACHEYGHALGLGHSSTFDTTMFATINGTGVLQRSIAMDDQLGIQSIYGAMSATKPRITGVQISGQVAWIHGAHFAAGGVEVWFTPANPTSDGVPVKVLGAGSAQGDLLQVLLPAAAGPGDVLVCNPGQTNESLSNAWPTNLIESCPAPVFHGQTSPNSVGAGATIGVSGTTSVAAADLVLTASGCPPKVFGLFFYGSQGASVPFGNGFRHVDGGAAGLFRLPIVLSDDGGQVAHSVPFSAPEQASGPGALAANSTWHFQFWYRDLAGGGAGFNLSDAVQVSFCN